MATFRKHTFQCLPRWWFQIFLEFSPRSLGKISYLTSVFFRWVAQPPISYFPIFFSLFRWSKPPKLCQMRVLRRENLSNLGEPPKKTSNPTAGCVHFPGCLFFWGGVFSCFFVRPFGPFGRDFFDLPSLQLFFRSCRGSRTQKRHDESRCTFCFFASKRL